MSSSKLPDVVMPVRRYVHPESGGRVTFVGMVHAAQPEFFALVRDLLGELEAEGATVYLEPPAQATPEQLEETQRSTRKRSLLHRKALDGAAGEATGLGLVFQSEHLIPQPGWETPDASALEQAAAFDQKTLRALKVASAAAGVAGKALTVRQQKKQLVKGLSSRVKVLTEPGACETVKPGIMGVLEAVRTAKVMEALDTRRSTQPDCHVVLVWGTEHLLGFERALTERGYKIEGEDRWLKAIDTASFLEGDTAGG